MPITTEEIKSLRDETGISIMQCRKALEESGGDREKALFFLRKAGSAAAAKKAGRALGAGTIQAYVHASQTLGAMVELNCETDFVAKNPEFKALAYDIGMHVAASAPSYLRQNDIPEPAKTEASALFREEIVKSGKPADVQEKMLAGKMSSYFQEKTLLDQQFIKDQDITIDELVKTAIQKFGEKIEIARFVRYSVLER